MSTPLSEQVQAAAGWIGKLRTEIGKVIVGQEQLVDRLLVGLLATGPRLFKPGRMHRYVRPASSTAFSAFTIAGSITST